MTSSLNHTYIYILDEYYPTCPNSNLFQLRSVLLILSTVNDTNLYRDEKQLHDCIKCNLKLYKHTLLSYLGSRDFFDNCYYQYLTRPVYDIDKTISLNKVHYNMYNRLNVSKSYLSELVHMFHFIIDLFLSVL